MNEVLWPTAIFGPPCRIFVKMHQGRELFKNALFMQKKSKFRSKAKNESDLSVIFLLNNINQITAIFLLSSWEQIVILMYENSSADNQIKLNEVKILLIKMIWATTLCIIDRSLNLLCEPPVHTQFKTIIIVLIRILKYFILIFLVQCI